MITQAHEYALEVLTGGIPACQYIKLACQRFFADLDNPAFWYDDGHANRFYKYCALNKHYKGPMKGKPIELESWQKFMFGQMYGFKRCVEATEDHLIEWSEAEPGSRLAILHPGGFEVGEMIKTDLLRFRDCYLEVPRKNGKTTIGACGAGFDCGFWEETGAEVYTLATKEEQAMILWRDFRAFIRKSPDLQEVFEVLQGVNTIYSKDSDRTNFVRALGSNSDTQDGLNPIAAYCDELHQWPDRDLLDVIENAFGARDDYHIVKITTAGNNRQGVCYQERKHGIDILEGRIVNDNKLVLIYTVDDEDMTTEGKVDYEKCLRDEKIWYKANPNLGKGKQISYMRDLALKASQVPSQLLPFLNKQLNIWTDASEVWLKWELWKTSHAKYDRETLRGKKCFLGSDLSKVDDLSAVCYWFPVQEGLDKVHLLVDFYCPKDSVKTREKKGQVPYDAWVKAGWIKETPGNTTDYTFILKDILDNRTFFEIAWGAFDRTFGGELIQSLMAEGMEVITAAQGFISMGPACDEVERQLLQNTILTNGNAVLDWCASNVVIVKDAANNKKPDKVASPDKIDGIVAMLNVQIGILAKTRKEPDKKNANDVYGRRGLRSLDSEDVENEESDPAEETLE